MTPNYVAFNIDIPSLGTSWQKDKHAKEWKLEEKGSWITLRYSGDARKPRVIRVPITSVAYMQMDEAS